MVEKLKLSNYGSNRVMKFLVEKTGYTKITTFRKEIRNLYGKIQVD